MAPRTALQLASAVIAAVALLVPGYASAELGGNVNSVQRDGARMNAAISIRQAGKYAVHELTDDSGSTVREYVGPDGNVFAVAWQGQFHPDYQQLLGTYFQQFQQAAALRRARRAPVTIELPGFVFQSFGHLRGLGGRAYVPQMLPDGVGVEEIK